MFRLIFPNSQSVVILGLLLISLLPMVGLCPKHPFQPYQDKHHDNQINTPPNGFDNAAHISYCR
ncbi:MAG: hypothetical protein AB2725_15450, partial [Candidatus Thiodiazotropha endolucinida]